MRIAMLARMLPRHRYAGGVSGQVHLLATELQRRGHAVTVFAQSPKPVGSPYDSRMVGDGSDSAAGWSSHLYPWLASKLNFDEFDLVHSHGDDHLLRTPRPVVRTFYGTARAEQRAARTLRHRAYHFSMTIPEWISQRRAVARVAISHAAAADLAPPVSVIPCGYDPAVFGPGDDKSDVPSVLFVGDLGTRKRAELLLKAFDETVLPSLPGAELWMVSSSEVSAKNVRWLGRLTTPELVRAYQRAWVFCLPSSYEGFGVPYIEALACGTPVVATANGGAEEALGTDLGGVIVPADAVGSTLVALLSDHARRDTLAAIGVARVQGFSIGRIADQYIDVYRQALTVH
jgi:glycosyltransferase involved in cell wall biosynthesis